MKSKHPLVAVVMGSKSDWDTMKNTCDILDKLDIEYVTQIVSAHRTPDLLFEFAQHARAKGIEVIIAGAGGAAHLPGMIAAKTSLPVLGVPIQSKALNGIDSLLSICQMPTGIPVGTLAIGHAGASNAGLLAASILSNKYAAIKDKLDEFRAEQTQNVLANLDPREDA
jgi:5-(carboxyamino)imidazole ribonucleotide mutase